MSIIGQENRVDLRPGRPEDAPALARICYDAFTSINAKHNFPPDFSSFEMAVGFMEFVLNAPNVYSVVAERDGKPVGSSFLWEHGVIGGVGPVTVDPAAQDTSAGRRMMEDLVRRYESSDLKGIRLIQAGFHMRSQCLYAKLGFDVKEPLVCLNGPPIGKVSPGHSVRPMTHEDLPEAEAVCQSVHGHSRNGELLGPIERGTARVAESNGRIVGYASDLGFFGHAAALDNEGLKSLIGAAEAFSGPGFLLPNRNGDLFRWCLENGLRAVQPMTLMAKGFYQDPAAPFLPSLLF